MYTNNAYHNNSLQDFKDKSRPLIVGSCGTYHLYTKSQLPTFRPKGRVDYQLLYIASGQAHFFFDDKETIVPAGNMVIYRPKEMQKYVYYGEEQAEVYWVHFTGSDVKNILRKYGINDTMRVIYTGTSLEYSRLFKQMIYELQQCQFDYEELLSMLLHQIFISIHRQITKDRKIANEYLETEMELATQYFNENYNTEISIEDYAASRGMSISWFIRSFKHYANTTPMQYIVSLRITNAQMLLENTTYSVQDIAAIVGYDNPLYFSRLSVNKRVYHLPNIESPWLHIFIPLKIKRCYGKISPYHNTFYKLNFYSTLYTLSLIILFSKSIQGIGLSKRYP